MKRLTLLLVAATLPFLAPSAESALYRTTIAAVSGRPLMPVSITVEEVDRTDTSSIIEVTSSADVTEALSSSVLAGLCGLARNRGERYIQARQISLSPLTLEVTFPKVGSNTANVPTSAMAPNVFPVSSCPSSR